MFHIRENWDHLTKRSAFQEPVIDGVRALAILWVMLFHMVYFQIGLFPLQTSRIFTRSATSWIFNGGQGVDLFFVISGFLMGTVLLRELRKTGGIVFSRFYVRRFLRLVPVYVVVMMIGLYLEHNMPGYPRWGNAQYMWANLLYINNFLPVVRQYMGWCWSLAIEEQFYLVLPACLLLFMGVGKGRIRVLVVLACISVALRFSVLHFTGFAPPFRFIPGSTAYLAFFDTIYDKPWMRFGGLLAGASGAYLNVYFAGSIKRFFARTKTVTAISLFCLCAIAHIATTGAGAVFFDRIPYLARELWWAFHRDVLSISVAFLMLAAIHTPSLFGGWLRRFLSWKVFYPIAQLSYSFYLVHEMVFERLFPIVAPLFWTHMGAYKAMAVDGIVGVAIATAMAVTLYVTIERNCMRLRSSPPVLRFIALFDRERKQQEPVTDAVQG